LKKAQDLLAKKQKENEEALRQAQKAVDEHSEAGDGLVDGLGG
jgi:hypothetical protein